MDVTTDEPMSGSDAAAHSPNTTPTPRDNPQTEPQFSQEVVHAAHPQQHRNHRRGRRAVGQLEPRRCCATLDALVVVSSPWVDGAATAGHTLDWLATRGPAGLLQRTVTVLNDSDGHADKRTGIVLAQQFSGKGQPVVEVPLDDHLRPAVSSTAPPRCQAPVRRRFVEVCAAPAAHFPTQTTGPETGIHPGSTQAEAVALDLTWGMTSVPNNSIERMTLSCSIPPIAWLVMI